MDGKPQTFESSLTSLEKIVRKLEQGDLSLEESLKLFEDGVKLSRDCQERLNQAERRIEILLNDDNGKPVIETIRREDLSEASASEPKVKRRIVFEEQDEDNTPF
jgi:exodeoxyribonuclease VII small subunit